MTLPGDPSNPLRGLKEAEKATGGKGLPPVEKWNPDFCGDIDMRIGADGTWFYMNSPIGRKPLVRLFSTILRHDADGKYYLITPVEKVGITVDDAPFLAIAMRVEGHGESQRVFFTTNCEDEVEVDGAHPLRFANEAGTGGLKPYVLVRGRLEALVNRAIFYDLVAAGVTHGEWFGIWAGGRFWPMQKTSELP